MTKIAQARRVVEAIVHNVRVAGKARTVHFKRVRNSDTHFSAKIMNTRIPTIRVAPLIGVKGYSYAATINGQEWFGRTPATAFSNAVKSLELNEFPL